MSEDDKEFYPAGKEIAYNQEGMKRIMAAHGLGPDAQLMPDEEPSLDGGKAINDYYAGVGRTLEEARLKPKEPDEFIIDLGELPASGEERLKLATGVLRAVQDATGEITEDTNPASVKEYNEQLKAMLDEGITLYNLMLGKWAMAKAYQVGESVYFTYYGVSHIGQIESIGKSEALIKFTHRNKECPKDEPKEIMTWRRKDQIKKP
jgi:hypothetical protein